MFDFQKEYPPESLARLGEISGDVKEWNEGGKDWEKVEWKYGS